MTWDTAELRSRFGQAANQQVISYLALHHPSAHSDVASELIDAAARLPDHRWYCPDPARYAYVFLHTGAGIIYGLATGMTGLYLRLPLEQRQAALGEAATPFPDLGPDWLSFEPWPASQSLPAARARLGHWCVHAYDYARTLDATQTMTLRRRKRRRR